MPEELIGVAKRELFRASDSDFTIEQLEGGIVVLGEFPAGSLVPSLEYRFVGKWESHQRHGRQFRVFGFVQRRPHTAGAVLKYLTQFEGIGPVIARKIWEAFGPESIRKLQEQPEGVAAAVAGLAESVAINAGLDIQKDEKFRDTRVELLGLLGGRGFPGTLIDWCIGQWQVSAAVTLRSDPFRLIELGAPGCGFLRVDQLYQDLGLPLKSERRLTMLAWHTVKSDMSGHTWHRLDELTRRMLGLCELNPKSAIETAVAQKWLAAIRIDGAVWIADATKGQNETYLASRLTELTA